MRQTPTHPAVTTQQEPRYWRAFMASLMLLVTLALVRMTLYLTDGFDATADGFRASPATSGATTLLPNNASGFSASAMASPITLVIPPYPTFPSVMTIVTMVPSPTPVRAPTPTIVPLNYCGMGSAVNSECVWAQPPFPTPTPLPTCATPVPGDHCLWRGQS